MHAVALQADGKVLAGGEFVHIGDPDLDTGPSALARLNAYGSLDTTFHPPVIPAGNDWGVRALLVQPDGKIVVGGQWGNAPMPPTLLRLNVDGTRDLSFTSALEPTAYVSAIQRQPDGKLLVSCYTYYSEVPPAVVRLHADGSLDASFQAPITATEDPRSLALQPDGRVLVGFRADGGIIRLNPDGSLDPSFQADVREVYAVAVQADGRIAIGGTFEYVNGVPVAGLARLDPGPVACRLEAQARTSAGPIPLLLTGVAGARYEILASSDLAAWTPLLSVTNTQGRTTVWDAGNLPFRFYRAKQVLP